MNNKKLSIFSSPEGTNLKGYKRFSHLSSYLKECSSQFSVRYKDAPHLLPMMKACHFKVSRPQSFRGLKQAWDEVSVEKIPITYIDYIGASRELIELEGAKDMANFRRYAKGDLSPETYTLRFMAAVYGGGKLPEGLSIDEAAEWILKRMDAKGYRLRFCLNFPDLKTVFFEKDGSSHTIWYRPELWWGKLDLFTGKNGKMVGQTYIS